MRKYYVLFATFLVITLCFSSCATAQYTEDDVIGLSSSEIVEKYGYFDRR